MPVSEVNRVRHRAILVSREFKWLFKAVPERFRRRVDRWLWRALFLSEEGQLTLAGEHALADLKTFALVGATIFSTDPLVMARRLGRREVVERIIAYLNLDEETVHKLMELDDGLE